MLAPIRLLRPAMYRFLSHSWIKPRSPTNTALFPTGNLRFILGSSPENRNALGSAVVDNLHQERPRLKYGYFFFFSVTMKVTFSLKNCHSKKKKRQKQRKRGWVSTEKLLFVLWMMILSTMLQTKPVIRFIRKAKLKKEKKKEMYT